MLIFFVKTRGISNKEGSLIRPRHVVHIFLDTVKICVHQRCTLYDRNNNIHVHD